MSQQSHLYPIRPSNNEPGGSSRAPQRRRAGRPLPTDRIKMEQQPKVLYAIGRLSGPGKRAVTGTDLGNEMSLAPTTAILVNKFFADAGWIDNRRGEYRATDALVDYTQRLSAAAPGPVPDKALEALRGPARKSWFWQAIYPYLTNGRLPYSDAVLLLMHEARATEDHQTMIDNLIAWLAYISLVTVQDDLIILTGHADGSPAAAQEQPAGRRPAPGAPVSAPAGTEGEKPTVQPGASPPDYVIAFDVRMTRDDLGRLDPDQLRQFLEAFGTVVTLSGKG